MRRIVERVVTVVTTTTWKISWEMDPPHPDPMADSVSNELPNSDVLSETVQSTRPDLTVTETKEVDLPEQESNYPADEPPEKPYSYPSKTERK